MSAIEPLMFRVVVNIDPRLTFSMQMFETCLAFSLNAISKQVVTCLTSISPGHKSILGPSPQMCLAMSRHPRAMLLGLRPTKSRVNKVVSMMNRAMCWTWVDSWVPWQ
jgi:hypothetical protein